MSNRGYGGGGYRGNNRGGNNRPHNYRDDRYSRDNRGGNYDDRSNRNQRDNYYDDRPYRNRNNDRPHVDEGSRFDDRRRPDDRRGNDRQQRNFERRGNNEGRGRRGDRSDYRDRRGGDREKCSLFKDTVKESANSIFDQLNYDPEIMKTANEIRLESAVDQYHSKLRELEEEKKKIKRYERFQKAMILPPFSSGTHAGDSGSTVALKSNFFQVTDRTNTWRIHVYNVKFANPEYDVNNDVPSNIRYTILSNQFKTHFDDNYIFDGKETIYSTKEIRDKVVKTCEHAGKLYQVTMIHTKCATSNELPALQAMNILMKRVYHLMKMKPLGRSFFDTEPDARKKITADVDAIMAVRSSISYYEHSSLLYLLDIHYKFEQTQSVLHVIRQMRSDQIDQESMKKNLIGRTVRTQYNNLTYNIYDVDFSMSPASTFVINDRQVSFADYVEKYHVRVRDMDQPLLVIKNKKKGPEYDDTIYLIPELCRLTGLPRQMLENLNAARESAKLTKALPTLRVETLEKFRKRFDADPKIIAEFKKLGLKIGNNLLDVRGRVIEPPNLLFNDGRDNVIIKAGEMFGKCIFSKRLLTNPPGTVDIFILCHIQAEDLGKDIADELYFGLKSTGGIRNVNIQINPLNDDSAESFCNEIARIANKCKLIVCILSNNVAKRYNAIKIQSSLINPVPTQVMIERTFRSAKNLRTLVFKVIPQIVAKLGGEPWGCKITSTLKNSSMYVGIDTYHDAARTDLSAAAFVASLNGSCTRMFSRVSYQLRSLELHVNMRPNVAEACIHWYRANNNNFPKHLFFFRDGVGDGQLEEAVNLEIEQITRGVEDAKEILSLPVETICTVTFIVVKKRIAARFYLDKGNGEYGNPSPGTIVDTRVTRSDWFDFYLISHSPREGTVNPVHYNVIYDTLKVNPDDIQMLAYRLSWLYYNYTGSISIPSVCGYAHKLAYLSGLNLSTAKATSNRPELSEQLFYL